jgi:hypothetical protein
VNISGEAFGPAPSDAQADYPATSVTVHGAPGGTNTTFSVCVIDQSTNIAKGCTQTNPVAIPPGPPGAVAGVSMQGATAVGPNLQSVNISWAPAVSNGAAVSYRVVAGGVCTFNSGDPTQQTVDATSVDFLAANVDSVNYSCDVSITPTNSVGDGPTVRDTKILLPIP